MIGFMVFVMFLMPKLVENMGKKNGLIFIFSFNYFIAAISVGI